MLLPLSVDRKLPAVTGGNRRLFAVELTLLLVRGGAVRVDVPLTKGEEDEDAGMLEKGRGAMMRSRPVTRSRFVAYFFVLFQDDQQVTLLLSRFCLADDLGNEETLSWNSLARNDPSVVWYGIDQQQESKCSFAKMRLQRNACCC